MKENKSFVLCRDCKWYQDIGSKNTGPIGLCNHPHFAEYANEDKFDPITGHSRKERLWTFCFDVNEKLDCPVHEKAEPKKSFFQKLRERFYVK